MKSLATATPMDPSIFGHQGSADTKGSANTKGSADTIWTIPKYQLFTSVLEQF